MDSHRLVRSTVFLLTLAILLFIPLRVISYGFLPGDDSQRHAAKVIAGKPWSEILVLRPEVTMDTHPGWHAFLRLVHHVTGWGVEELVVFSMLFLFYLVCFTPPLFLRRPEAWLAAMFVLTLSLPYYTARLVIGRPLLVSVFVLFVLFFCAKRLEQERHPRITGVIITALIALATWVHCTWYLFALPAAGFLAARRWRAAGRLILWMAIGVTAGALFTGQPITFLKQTINWPLWALDSQVLQRMLVIEFRPGTGDILFVLFITGLVLWRRAHGKNSEKLIENPAFVTTVICWILGFVSRRFWMDWGLPAAAVWLTMSFQDIFESTLDKKNWRRVLLAAVLGATLLLHTGSDLYGRWTMYLDTPYLEQDNASYQSWMPDPGGIVYSDDMTIFYDTFFRNPLAPWRYMVGFEPAVMPAEDLAIFRTIQWHDSAGETFKPWINKMTPADRLILRRETRHPPSIPALEWRQPIPTVWIGRLPRNSSNP